MSEFQKEIDDFVKSAEDGDLAIIAASLNLYGDAIVNEKGKAGLTALTWACIKQHKEIIELLLENSARIDERVGVGEGTALMFAASNGHLEIVKLLLEKGADINAQDKGGETALIWAIKNSKKEMVQFLQVWPENERHRAEKRHAEWLDKTDCAKGLKDHKQVPQPIRIPKVKL